MGAKIACRLRSFVAATVLVATLPSASALAEGVLLGSRTVRDGTDHDVISVADGKQYNQVQLCVANRSVTFYDVDIHFGNGGVQDVSMKVVLDPGQCTRWVDLAGDGARHINRIDLWYSTLVNTGNQGVVSAYGR
ncbi:MAG TPA: hypothetical protein VJL84_07020 [Kiloniellales bacterium]|nr:hypothetical protein [Kiloniellales bacterium]